MLRLFRVALHAEWCQSRRGTRVLRLTPLRGHSGTLAQPRVLYAASQDRFCFEHGRAASTSSLGRWGAAFGGLGLLAALVGFGIILFFVVLLLLAAHAMPGP